MTPTPIVTSTDETALAPSRFPNRWALFPVGLLGILVTVQAVLFSLARTDPSFAVESEYYQKAVSWDQELSQRALNTQLGWLTSAQLTLDPPSTNLRVTLTDAESTPIVGATTKVTAFPNARASQIQHVSLHEAKPGVYVGPVQLVHLGEWEIRVTAERGGRTYTSAVRVSPSTNP